MTNGEFDWKVSGRTIKFPTVDGLTPLEQQTLVGQVEQRMLKVQDRMGIVDTSKQAIVAAYELAAELYIHHQRSETNRTADSRKVEELIGRLEKTLGRK